MKDLRVLELNANFVPLSMAPLSTISWQTAFKKIVEGTAVPIKFYEGEYINTPNTRYQVPSVIVLREYKHLKKFAKWSKFNVKLMWGFHCQYCGKRFSEKSLTIDHVIPKMKGGKHGWDNSLPACKICNAKKGHKTDIIPLNKPYRPTYYQLTKKMLEYKLIKNPEWEEFLIIK